MMRDRAFLKAEMHFRQAMNVIPAAYNLPHHYVSAGNLASTLIRQSEPRQSEVRLVVLVNASDRRKTDAIVCVFLLSSAKAISLFNVALQEMDRFDKDIPPLVSECGV